MDDGIKIFRNNNDNNFVIFLHGFTGSANEWEETALGIDSRFNTAAISLPGHDNYLPEDSIEYTENGIISHINEMVNRITNKGIILAGYSMGGRAAIGYTNFFSEKVTGLILESSSPGIENENDQQARYLEDRQLARFIEENEIENFLTYWYSKPLFTGIIDNPEKFTSLFNEKRKLNRQGLINSLLGFSTGKFNHWHNISNFEQPTLLITGSGDKKFTQINKKMEVLIPKSEHIEIEAGHNVHFQKNGEYVEVINKFLDKYFVFLQK